MSWRVARDVLVSLVAVVAWGSAVTALVMLALTVLGWPAALLVALALIYVSVLAAIAFDL